jgi:hypothetical protein
MIPGLYSLFLKRLCEIKSRKKIIPFSDIFEKICRSFSMTKEECWEVLFLLRDTGFIEINSGHGIKIIKKEMTRKEGVKLLAREIPITCINECDKCQGNFEAKITIQDTCNKCSKEMIQKIKEQVKKEIKKGNTNPKWILTLQALAKEKS